MAKYQAAYTMPRAIANSVQLSPREYQHCTVIPLSGAIGAEITGIDVGFLSQPAFRELRQAIGDHQVLAIRNQTLTPKTLEAFAERFGPLMKYDFVEPLSGHQFATEIRSEPADTFNFGGGWHSDSMNYVRPPALTMLYGLEVPKTGGDTAFSNLYMAWESLSPGLQKMLRPMKQVVATSLSYGSSTDVSSKEYQNNISTKPKLAGPKEDDEFIHPVARTHPYSGRIALYLCSAYTARFESMTRNESLPLLQHLFEHTFQPEFTCRLSWGPGTLAIWDNRCTIHYAHNDYPGSRRVMHRVIVQGERPY